MSFGYNYMNRRRRLIDDIDNAIDIKNWDLCAEVCFRCIYGLPYRIQIDLCVYMMKRYLSIFEYNHKDVSSPREVIFNPEAWIDKYGNVFHDPDVNLTVSDNSFLYGIVSLLCAINYRKQDGLLTSSCVCCILSAIHARGVNVWIADDPEGLEKWRAGTLSPGETALENNAYVAVVSREWRELVSLLLMKEIFSLPDDVNVSEMNKILDDWRRNEFLLIVPRPVIDTFDSTEGG
jgi:hypothetical protein